MQEQHSRSCVLIGALAGLLMTLVGCGGGSAADEPTVTPVATSSSTEPALVPSTTAVTEEQARQIALGAVGGGQVTGVVEDDKEGVPVWEVKITAPDGSTVKVSVNIATGEVVLIEGLEVLAEGLTEDEASQIALAAVGGGQVTGVEPDDKEGRQVWEVKVTLADGSKVKVSVDIATGEVLLVEEDSD